MGQSWVSPGSVLGQSWVSPGSVLEFRICSTSPGITLLHAPSPPHRIRRCRLPRHGQREPKISHVGNRGHATILDKTSPRFQSPPCAAPHAPAIQRWVWGPRGVWGQGGSQTEYSLGNHSLIICRHSARGSVMAHGNGPVILSQK